MVTSFFKRKKVEGVTDIYVDPKLKRKPRTLTNVTPDSTDPDCNACGLHNKCKSPKMKMSGEGRKGILIIAQAPGKEEDEQNTQLVGRTGDWFESLLQCFNIDLHKDCYKINSVNCRTSKPSGENRAPTKNEIKCCRPMVWKAIRNTNPHDIWLMGGEAMYSFWGSRFSKIYANRFRGLVIPDPTTNAWVLPMYHPSYPMRFEHDKHLQMVFERDILRAAEGLDSPRPTFANYNSMVTCLTNHDDIMAILRKVKTEKPPVFVFDYETNRIKPFVAGSRILTCSFSIEKDKAYSFPIDWHNMWNLGQGEQIRNTLQDILRYPEIGLVAQNIVMESSWSRQCLWTKPVNWLMDTMVATHIFDSRSDFTGLKFQAYVRWGVEDYGRELKPFMETTDEKGFNNLEKAPLEKVLHYGGLDSLFEHWLFLEHYEDFQLPENEDLHRAYYDLFHDGILSYEKTHWRGLQTNEAYYSEEHDRISKLIKLYEGKILSSSEAILFKEKEGRSLKTSDQKDFSSQNLKKLFFTYLGYEPIKQTQKGGDSADHEVLEKIDTAFTKRIVAFRKLSKIRGYIEQFQREMYENTMHPFFNLHRARSNRSSADSPSFQNIPTRDKEAKKSVRSGIMARIEHQLMDDDYSSMEVRIIACESECPELVAYINNPTTCMHRDQAAKIFLLETSNVSKDIRFYSKNGWVFPEFYTSYFKSCARNIWPVIPALKTVEGQNLLEHLCENGIETYQQFEDHLKVCEDEFWDKFRAIQRWQDKACREYLEKGYVTMKFGHRRGGYIERGQVINSKIQGPAYHCQLRSYNIIEEIYEDERWDTYQCGQIHDSILSDHNPNEWETVSTTRTHVMTNVIREENPWIIVPLEVERELSPINGSWYDKVEVNADGVCIVKGHPWENLRILGAYKEDLPTIN